MALQQQEQNRESELQIGIGHRFLAGAIASVFATLLVTPLDVVKTRMQARSISSISAIPFRSTVEALQPKRIISNLCGSIFSQVRSPPSPSCPAACSPTLCSAAVPLPQTQGMYASAPQGMLKTLQGIIKKEGLLALWKGVDTALLVSVPMVGIYMPSYDMLRQKLSPELGNYATPVAGIAARTAAVIATAPLELLRTRKQAFAPHENRQLPRSMASLLDRSSYSSRTSTSSNLMCNAMPRLQRLWKGVGATLARDIPFTVIYWSIVEPIREGLQSDCNPSSSTVTLSSDQMSGITTSSSSSSNVLWVNLLAGSVAGAFAATVTTPFDVAKTRLQISTSPQIVSGRCRTAVTSGTAAACSQGQATGTFGTLYSIWKAEGVQGLFNGVGPRAARVAPACAIVIAGYDIMKEMIKDGSSS